MVMPIIRDLLHAIYNFNTAHSSTDPSVFVHGTMSVAGAISVSSSTFNVGNVGQSGSWTTAIRDSSGNPIIATNATPVGTEQALITRPILSGTQTISGNVRIFDSSGNTVIATNATPVGTEQGLIVRQILSGTQTVSGNVRIFDSSGNTIIATNAAPVGTEQGLIVRPIQSGTMTTSGNVRIFDSSGNVLIATNTMPKWTEPALITRPIFPTSINAALSNVAGTTGSVVVVTTDGTRKGMLIVNDSTANLLVKYGLTASASSYSVRMPTLSYWEMPQPIWQGEIDAIWDSANTGAARITIIT